MANRVTTSMIYGSLMGGLQNNLQNLLNLQRQMATGNKYSKLSDNPAAITRSLSLQSSITSNAQYVKTQQDAISLLEYSETIMDSVINDLQTIRILVINAGDGAMDKTAVAAIADQIDTLKQSILDSLNTKFAGKYVFGGTDTTTKPFVMDASGQIRYVGSDERIRYQIEEGLLSDVSFTGKDIIASDFDSYFVCSHYVPTDWKWTGREEKVQITVGNRTLSVYIPEEWLDEVATGTTKPTDYNEFRDPDELSGISLDDLAMLVNRSLTEQGADMLVTASVEKDYNAGQQRLIFKSNTGEPISVTGWPDTDYLPMPQSIAGLDMSNTDMKITTSSQKLVGSAAPNFEAMKSQLLTVQRGTFQVTLDLNDFFSAYNQVEEQTVENLAQWMNKGKAGASLLPAGVTADVVNGKIAFLAMGSDPIQLSGTGLQGVTGGTNASSEKVTKYWSQNQLVGSAAPSFAGMTGKSLIVYHGATSTALDLQDFFTANPNSEDQTIENLAQWMNTGNAGASFLPTGVTADVVNGKIAFISTTGEKIQLDGTGVEAVTGGVKISGAPEYNGLMGSVNTLGWKGDGLKKAIDISITSAAGTTMTQTFKLDDYKNISELTQAINAVMSKGAGDADVASIVSGRLVLQSTLGEITVKDSTSVLNGTAGGTAQLFGQNYTGGIAGSSSSLTVQLGDAEPIKIYINEGDTLAQIADRVSAIEGIYARTSADGDQLVVVAERIGNEPDDPLAVDAAAEKLHYPSFKLWGEGMAMSLFDFSYAVDSATEIETGVVGSQEKTRPVDHSHMDVFDYLGMETALKGREYKEGEVLVVGTYDENTKSYTGEPLHWRIISGSHVTDIKLNPGAYTMEQLAERLKNAGAGWLEVTVDVFRGENVPSTDDTETGLGTSANKEDATSRLVIRSTSGSPVSIMDMNNERYAEEVGLSTALRADDKMGMKEIVLPTAPCVDPNIAAMVRVQKTCGAAYDIRLMRKDILNTDGTVDRVKVMEQIAKQANDQAGYEFLRVVIPVDVNGQKLTNSASLVAVTGEPFEVVDLPFLDPVWSGSYTPGVAAQMGIHGGVTSNLAPAGIKDDTKMGVSGTIRFESLGHSVEIDVMAGDTVKTVMDRLRSQAGDWLYVNYFDAAMGNSAGQEGDYPIIAIAAKDGSAVSVIDVEGSVAEEKLLLNTSVQGKAELATYNSDGTVDTFTGWTIDLRSLPGYPNYDETYASTNSVTPQTFSITVAGYTHTIDLTAMRDFNGNGLLDAADLVETINARMQDEDVKAELNKDGYLALWSPRGYTIEVEAKALGTGANGADTDITATFFGTGTSSTAYRGGYDLENASREAPGIYTQNVVTRGGANLTKQSFFGVLDDISAAVRAENRDGLADKLLPMIDKFMDTLLRIQSTNGALQARYESNIFRMELDGINMTEVHNKLIGSDLESMIALTTELTMAQAVYQASLGVISYIVQPTLLDFLR